MPAYCPPFHAGAIAAWLDGIGARCHDLVPSRRQVAVAALEVAAGLVGGSPSDTSKARAVGELAGLDFVVALACGSE